MSNILRGHLTNQASYPRVPKNGSRQERSAFPIITTGTAAMWTGSPAFRSLAHWTPGLQPAVPTRIAGWWSSTTLGSYPKDAGASPAPATNLSGPSLAVCRYAFRTPAHPNQAETNAASQVIAPTANQPGRCFVSRSHPTKRTPPCPLSYHRPTPAAVQTPGELVQGRSLIQRPIVGDG